MKRQPTKPKSKSGKSRPGSKAASAGERLRSIDPSGRETASFFEQVYDVVEQIPHGRVTTYGAIAKCLGSGLSARMVGWALNGSYKGPRSIPAQRVVNRNGQLSGKMHFATPTRMQELLEAEGIVVKDDTIQHFDKLFWDPATEL
jgi:methylated-DNA-protein-cysteine methyltransferase-like protein